MAGGGGKPNSFIVPTEMKTTAATMRRTLRILAGQGAGAGSKIDMELLLLDDAVPEMSDTGGLDHPGSLQFDPLRAHMLEQSATTVPEENGRAARCCRAARR